MSETPDYVPLCAQMPGIEWLGPGRKLQIVMSNDDALKISLLLRCYSGLVASRKRVAEDVYLPELFVIKDGIDAMFNAIKDAKAVGSAL